MNYTIDKALKSIHSGPTGFATTIADVISACVRVDPDFDVTIANVLKQLQGAVNMGYSCVELQQGGYAYANWVVLAGNDTPIHFYLTRDLEYATNRPNVPDLSPKPAIDYDRVQKQKPTDAIAVDPDHKTKTSGKKPARPK
jgi:hypothetical protein